MGISQLLIVVEVLGEGRVLRRAGEAERSVATCWASRCRLRPEAGPAPPPGWLQLCGGHSGEKNLPTDTY